MLVFFDKTHVEIDVFRCLTYGEHSLALQGEELRYILDLGYFWITSIRVSSECTILTHPSSNFILNLYLTAVVPNEEKGWGQLMRELYLEGEFLRPSCRLPVREAMYNILHFEYISLHIDFSKVLFGYCSLIMHIIHYSFLPLDLQDDAISWERLL